jgi:hypothetical protein
MPAILRVSLVPDWARRALRLSLALAFFTSIAIWLWPVPRECAGWGGAGRGASSVHTYTRMPCVSVSSARPANLALLRHCTHHNHRQQSRCARSGAMRSCRP